jgi:hypothetical protein
MNFIPRASKNPFETAVRRQAPELLKKLILKADALARAAHGCYLTQDKFIHNNEVL